MIGYIRVRVFESEGVLELGNIRVSVFIRAFKYESV